jgi:hypothetical protein
MRVVDLLYNQPYSFIHILPALAICHKMLVDPRWIGALEIDLVVYAQHNKFIQDNPPHRKEENDIICMQRKNHMGTMPSNPWLEYLCTHCTKIFHYKSQCAQSFHNYHEDIASDPSNELS